MNYLDQWKALLSPAFLQLFEQINQKVQEEVQNGVTICPPPGQIWQAFQNCSPYSLYLGIISTEPSPDPSLATGLAFCDHDQKSPPLKLAEPLRYAIANVNAYTREQMDELMDPDDPASWFDDFNQTSGLSEISRHNVLLANLCPSTRAFDPGAHLSYGYSDLIIEMLAQAICLDPNKYQLISMHHPFAAFYLDKLTKRCCDIWRSKYQTPCFINQNGDTIKRFEYNVI